jgi:c-di-GMP-binding flagellar brake protein YcgR
VTSTPGFGIGVQFKEISELDKQALQQFIQSNTRISTL